MAIELSVNVSVNRADEIKRIPDALAQAFAKISAEMSALQAKTSAGNTTLISGLQSLADQTLKAVVAQGTLNTAFLQTDQAQAAFTNGLQQLTPVLAQETAALQASGTATAGATQSATSYTRSVAAMPPTLQATTAAQTTLAQSFAAVESSAQRAAGAVGPTTSTFAAGMQRMTQGSLALQTAQADLARGITTTGQAVTPTLNQFQKMQQQIQATNQATRLSAAGFHGMITSLSHLAAGFGVILGVQGLIGLARGMVDAGLQMSKFERTLQAATGSQAGAQQAMSFLVAESNRLGQSLSVMIPTFVQLTAATRGTTIEGERTRALFSSLVGAGQAVGLSTEGVGRAMIGLVQIISQNAIQLDEFRNQFASQIPGAMRETAIALGKMGVTATGTIAEMLALIDKQKLSVNDLTTAVTMGLKEVQKAAPSMANTAEAAFAQFGNAILKLKADIANAGIIEFLADMAQRATHLIQITSRFLGTGAGAALKQIDMLNEKTTELIKTRDDLLKQREMSGGVSLPFDEKMLADVNEALRLNQEQIKSVFALRDAKAGAAKDAEAQGASGRADEQRQLDALKAQDALAKRIGDASSANRVKIKAELADVQAGLDAIAQKNTALMVKIGIDPTSEADVKQANTRLEKDRQDLQDKLANVDKKGAGTRRTVAGEQARGEIETLQASMKQQIDLAKQGADERRKLSDDALAQRAHTEPTRYAQIQQASEDARSVIAREEAQTIEQIRTDTLTKLQALENTRYAAAKVVAGSSAQAQAAVEADHVKRVAETEGAIIAAKTNTAQAEQDLSHKTLEVTLKDARSLVEAKESLAQQEIESRLSVIDAQKGLIQAQVEGEVLSKAEGVAQTKVLQQEQFDQAIALLQRKAAAETQAIEDQLAREVAAGTASVAVQEGYAAQKQAIMDRQADEEHILQLRQQTELQTVLNTEQRAYEQFVDRVTGQVASVFEQLLTGTLDLVQTFKQLVIKTISQLAAEIATRAIIVPIIGQVIGGVGGALGGAAAAGGTGGMGGLGIGDLTTGAGLAKQLYDFFWGGQGGGMFGSLSSGIDSLNATMTNLLYGTESLTSSINTLADTSALGAAGTPLSASTVGPTFSALGVAGGLAAVGGGIYGAVNAQNDPARAAYAASAAAGAFAAATASGLLAAAGVTAATTGWTGYGLIAAAVLAVIGTILDSVIKPKGPRLAVAVGTGLTIGMQGDQLAVGGDLGSTVLRSERAGGSAATDPLRAGLEEGVTNAVESMVAAINAVAVDASVLLDATSQALDTALASALVVNSSNADKMEADIKAQLEFIPLQISGFFLKPLSEAFAQIKGVDSLDEQISRFGVSVVGMATIFTAMNTKITELNQVANTDVLRSFGQIHEQLNAFALQLEQDATAIAEDITTQVTSMLEATANRLVDLSAQIQVAAIPGAFAQPIQAIGSLQTAVGAMEQAGLNAEGVQAQLTALIQSTVDAAFQVIDAAIASAPFDEVLAVILAIPPAVAQLDPELQKLQQITQAFAMVVGPLSIDIEKLRLSVAPLGSTMAEATADTEALIAAIGQSGDDLALLFPLYDQLHQSIMNELALKEQQIQAQAAIIESSQSLITQIDQQLNGQGLSAAALADITAQWDALNATLGTLISADVVYQTGAAVIDTLNQMAALMTEVLNRAQQDLDAIHQVQSSITANLHELVAATTPLDQQIATQVQHIADLNAQIAAGGDPSTVIPLYDELQQATMALLALQAQQIQQQLDGTLAQLQAQQALIEAQQASLAAQQEAAQLQQHTLQAQAAQLEQNLSVQQQLLEQSQALATSLRAQVRSGQAPVQQADAIRAAISIAQGQLAGQSGQEAIETLSTLQSLFGELQQLGEQTNQLDLIAEALHGLSDLIPLADAQAAMAQHTISLDQAQLNATTAQLAVLDTQLATLQAQRDALNAIQTDTAAADAAQAQADAALFAVQHAAMASLQAMQPALDAMATDAQTAIDYAEDQLIAIQDLAKAEKDMAEKQLIALTGTTDPTIGLLTVQSQALEELQLIDLMLADLYYQQEAVKNATEATAKAVEAQNVEAAKPPEAQKPIMVTPSPLPVTIVNGGGGGGGDDGGEQFGGLVQGFQWGGALRPIRPEHLPPMPRFNGGGMATIRTEPGERVYQPKTPQEHAALQLVNTLHPRMDVPGTGSGDTVPMRVPLGSFVLNREAVQAVKSVAAAAEPPRAIAGRGLGHRPPTTHTMQITTHQTATRHVMEHHSRGGAPARRHDRPPSQSAALTSITTYQHGGTIRPAQTLTIAGWREPLARGGSTMPSRPQASSPAMVPARPQDERTQQIGGSLSWRPTGPAYAAGGPIRIITEPGEWVFPGPLTPHVVQTLETVNTLVPRMAMGGLAPMPQTTPMGWSPDPSGRPWVSPQPMPGFQEGGIFNTRHDASAVFLTPAVSERGGTSGTTSVTHTTHAPVTINLSVTVPATVTNEMDIRELANKLGRYTELQLRSKLGRRT